MEGGGISLLVPRMLFSSLGSREFFFYYYYWFSEKISVYELVYCMKFDWILFLFPYYLMFVLKSLFLLLEIVANYLLHS